MYHYQIIDTASGEKLGVLGFDPEAGFYVEQSAAKSGEKAMTAMAEDLNELEHFHIPVQNGFSGTVYNAFTRDDPALPGHIPAVILTRFLFVAEPIET